MGTLDYIILAAVAVWFLAAIRSILKKKDGCGCGCVTGSKTKRTAFCSSCGCCGGTQHPESGTTGRGCRHCRGR